MRQRRATLGVAAVQPQEMAPLRVTVDTYLCRDTLTRIYLATDLHLARGVTARAMAAVFRQGRARWRRLLRSHFALRSLGACGCWVQASYYCVHHCVEFLVKPGESYTRSLIVRRSRPRVAFTSDMRIWAGSWSSSFASELRGQNCGCVVRVPRWLRRGPVRRCGRFVSRWLYRSERCGAM